MNILAESCWRELVNDWIALVTGTLTMDKKDFMKTIYECMLFYGTREDET